MNEDSLTDEEQSNENQHPQVQSIDLIFNSSIDFSPKIVDENMIFSKPPIPNRDLSINIAKIDFHDGGNGKVMNSTTQILVRPAILGKVPKQPNNSTKKRKYLDQILAKKLHGGIALADKRTKIDMGSIRRIDDITSRISNASPTSANIASALSLLSASQ